MKNLHDRRGVPSAILLCRTEANTTALRDALEWIDAAGIACFETLIPKRQDILNAKSTRPRGSACTNTGTWPANSSRPYDSSRTRRRTCEEHEPDAPAARPDRAAQQRTGRIPRIPEPVDTETEYRNAEYRKKRKTGRTKNRNPGRAG